MRPAFPVIRSRPRLGRASPSYLMTALKDLLSHWDLLWNFVARDFQGRYAGSLIGIVWNVIHPLVLIVIYIVVFSRIMGARLPGTSDVYGYGIYLCAGLLPWNAFAEVISRSTTVFIDQSHLLKKVNLPKKVLSASVALSGLINFLIVYAIFFVFLLLTGHRLGWATLVLPPLVAFQFVFAIGLGLVLATLHTFFRDVAQLVSVVLQFWFWLTPIVYLEDVIPDAARGVLHLNPMYYFVRGYRLAIVPDGAPAWPLIGTTALLALGALVAGSVVFLTLKDEIVDEV